MERFYIGDRCIVKKNGKYTLYLLTFNREKRTWDFIEIDEVYSIEEGIDYNIENVIFTKDMLECVLTDP